MGGSTYASNGVYGARMSNVTNPHFNDYGFYGLRGMFYGALDDGVNNFSCKPIDFDLPSKTVKKVMPIFKGFYPAVNYLEADAWKFFMCSGFSIKNHFGFFSTDYILNKGLDINNGIVRTLNRVDYDDPYIGLIDNMLDPNTRGQLS